MLLFYFFRIIPFLWAGPYNNFEQLGVVDHDPSTQTNTLSSPKSDSTTMFFFSLREDKRWHSGIPPANNAEVQRIREELGSLHDHR